MNKYRAILFDFDGVILDTLHAKGRAFAKLFCNDEGEIFKEVMAFHLERGGVNRVDKIKLLYEKLHGTSISEELLSQHLNKLKTYMRECLFECPPIDNAVLEVVQSLSTSTLLWVVSAAPKDEVEPLCVHLGIHSCFRGIYGNSKKTEVISNVLKQEEFKPSEVLFIGDAEEDFNAARANQVDFVLKRNFNNPTQFSQNFSGKFISHFKELPGYL